MSEIITSQVTLEISKNFTQSLTVYIQLNTRTASTSKENNLRSTSKEHTHTADKNHASYTYIFPIGLAESYLGIPNKYVIITYLFSCMYVISIPAHIVEAILQRKPN